VHDGRDTRVLEAAGEVRRRDLARLDPTLDRDPPVAGVDSDSDAPRVTGSALRHELGIAQGHRAQDDPVDPQRERVRNGALVPDATTELHRDRSGALHDPAHGVRVARPPAAGSVEVHHVEPRHGVGQELLRHPGGVVGIDADALVVTLREPHATARQHVDGRDELEAAHSAAASARAAAPAPQRASSAALSQRVPPPG
jgi:hypothetical protein